MGIQIFIRLCIIFMRNMINKIIIAADQKSRRLSHKQSLEEFNPDTEFILVKSFEEIMNNLDKVHISKIFLDQHVCDSGKHRTRKEAIAELKEKVGNIPIIIIGNERDHALKSFKDGADGFLPISWL